MSIPFPRTPAGSGDLAHAAKASRRLPHLTRRVWIAIALITLARLAYQVWLSPYELVSDEAQYWDWSRRLDWSYYSKGPGIAWLIASSTRLLGVTEWTVRLPATLAFGVTSAVVAHLAIECSDDRQDQRAAMRAVLLVALVPAYQLSALLMTIDAPFIACWAIATWAAWRGFRGEADGRPSWPAWMTFAVAVGVGFLFKYTMLLIVPGLALLAWLERNRGSWRAAWTRAILAGVVLGICVLPVVWWNVLHHGAGLSHLLGFLAMNGGDRPARPLGYQPEWTIEYLASQIGVIGPMLAIVVLALRTASRGTSNLDRRGPLHPDCAREAIRFALYASVPSLLLFLVASLRTPIEGNWPIAAYVSLVPMAAAAIGRHGTRVRRWWRLTVVYGSVSLAAIHAPLLTARLPIVGRLIPAHRFAGSAAAIRRLGPPIGAFLAQADHRGLIVAETHNATGLLAFYLPGHPPVASAGRDIGNRPSAYDFFPDVSLSSALTWGRPAVLIGSTPAIWREKFDLADIAPLPGDPVDHVTSRFGGPKRRALDTFAVPVQH